MEIKAREEGCEGWMGQTYNFRDIGLAGHDALRVTLVVYKYVQSGPRNVILCRSGAVKLYIQVECQSPEVLIGYVGDWSVLNVTKTTIDKAS